MINEKLISKKALIKNLLYCKNFNKTILAMVKANAYGHGLSEVVKILKNKVNYWGVATVEEAIKLKNLLNNKHHILVVGKSQKFIKLIKNKIDITIDSLSEAKQILNICNMLNIIANIHIAINSGMNRLGVKSIKHFKKIISFINKNKKLKLRGIFTHCFDADSNTNNFYKQMSRFKNFVDLIKKQNLLIHIGGSFCLTKNLPNFVNMIRVGYFLYGYGNNNLKPVMTIKSKVIKIIKCNKDEYVGYGKTKLSKNKTIAIVPIGYADGVPRNLSNKACVIIKNKYCKIIGKICMDMLMVDITNKNVKRFDKVTIFKNAEYFAKIAKTSPYEILTNFNKSRTKHKIV